MDDLLAGDSVKQLTTGEVITGTILSVRKHEVLVDLGAQGVGVVPRREVGYSRNLAVGDEVLTVGGLFGKVTAIKDDVVTVEIAANTQVQLQKGAITTVLPKGTLKSA